MERELSRLERTWWGLDKIACCNTVVVARLAGPLADATLRRAVRRTQRRHPLLQAHVDTSTGQPRFVTAGTARAGIRTIDHVRRAHAEAGWQHQTEVELNQRFEGNAPPMRVVSIRPSEVGDGSAGDAMFLLLTVPSWIVDGDSAMTILHEILDEASAQIEGSEVERPPGAEPPPIDDILPRAGGSGSGFRLWGKPKRMEADQALAATARLTRFIHADLRPKEVDQLTARCHRERVELSAALHAALANAIARDVNERTGKHAPVTCGLTTSFREELPPGRSEEVLRTSSTIFTTHKTAKVGFWDLARDASDQIGNLLGRNQAIAVCTDLAKIAPGSEAEIGQMVSKLEKQTQATVDRHQLISPLPTHIGPFEVRKLSICESVPANELARVTVTEHKGWIDYNVCYAEGALARERAEALAERSVATLRQAISGDGDET